MAFLAPIFYIAGLLLAGYEEWILGGSSNDNFEGIVALYGIDPVSVKETMYYGINSLVVQ